MRRKYGLRKVVARVLRAARGEWVRVRTLQAAGAAELGYLPSEGQLRVAYLGLRHFDGRRVEYRNRAFREVRPEEPDPPPRWRAPPPPPPPPAAIVRPRPGARHPKAMKPAKIINLLRTARGRVLSAEEIVQEIWGDDPEGGPQSKIVHVYVCQLRKLGFPIETAFSRGYRYAGTLRIEAEPLSEIPRTLAELLGRK